MKKSLVYNSVFLQKIAAEPFIVVDIGARGQLQQPWLDMNKSETAPLKVVAFEPDQDECAKLQKKYGGKHIVSPLAVWSEKGEVTFHLDGGRSSIHGPNLDSIKQFEKRNWECRTGFVEKKVPCDTLDNIMQNHNLQADFIKCDTQGSEYEIFQGAKEQLTRYAGGAVAETWTIEAHKGQRLGFEVDRLCHEAGFELVLKQVRGNWYRSSDSRMVQRPQETQHDALYFKKPDVLLAQPNITSIKVMKVAAIAEYYGFTGYAYDVLARALADERPAFKQQQELLLWCQQTLVRNNTQTRLQKKLHGWVRRLRSDKFWSKIFKDTNLYRNL